MNDKNLAIVIGSSEYSLHEDNLSSVKNDVGLISNILTMSDKYTEVLVILDNKNSADVKSILSTFINKYKKDQIHEILFYFSGHGIRKANKDNDELYLKLYDTTNDKLSSTALSNSEIDGYLRELNPSLAVKILDCCNSGTNYLKDSHTPFFNKMETQAKAKFSDLIFISSSKADEASHALDDYSFFTKALAVSITNFSLESIIYYKDLISSITDYSQNNYYPEPQTTMQGSFLNSFIQYNEKIYNYLNNELELNKKDILEDSINILFPAQESDGEKFGLMKLESLVKDKSSSYLSKDEILIFIKNLQERLISEKNYSDFEKLFNIDFSTNTSVPNPDSVGEWVNKNQHKDFFCEPIYETQQYRVKEYVPAPKKIKKINKNDEKSSFLRSLGIAGFNNYEEIEEILEEVIKYKTILTGFNITCSLEINDNSYIYESISISLKPKIDYLFLRSYKIFLVILFSFKEVAVFSKIHTLKQKNWDEFTEIEKTKWFVKETNMAQVNEETLADQIIDSIKNKIEESIKNQLSNQKDGDQSDS